MRSRATPTPFDVLADTVTSEVLTFCGGDAVVTPLISAEAATETVKSLFPLSRSDTLLWYAGRANRAP
jgi:hypothetical protein